MTAYASTCDIAAIAARLRGANTVAILSHSRPDGDAAGSILALARALRVLGKRVDAVFTGAVDPNILALADAGEARLDTAAPLDPATDVIVVVDTGAFSQLEPLDGIVRQLSARVVGIDHHARGDAVAPDRVVDTSAAATTQIIARLIDELGVDLRRTAPNGTRTIAEALFVGLATDTGWFRFQSADAAVFALASRLLEAGVDRIALYQSLEENARPARLAATAVALASLRSLCGGRVATMALSHADFLATKATSDDATGVVNIPLEVGVIAMSALMTESQPGITKVSFRSKPRTDGRPWVNVSDFAAQFGGGGHALAAGARVKVALPEARAQIEAAIEAIKGLAP